MKRVFISKNLKECEPVIDSLRDSNYEFICKSLIKFDEVPFEINEDYEVLFFGSIRSFDFFTKKMKINDGVEIACAGRTTANYIKQYGYDVQFVPFSPDVNVASEEFRDWLGSRKVLFPTSDKTLKTFSNKIKPDQLFERIIYTTKLEKQKVPASDLYFFSSPSNVDAFFLMNTIYPSAKVFAWGRSTGNRLKELNVVATIMEAPSIEEVLNILK